MTRAVSFVLAPVVAVGVVLVHVVIAGATRSRVA